MPLLFAPTIGAALAARYHFLWVYCPACRTTRDIDPARSIATVTRGHEPDPFTVLPLVPSSCTVRSTRAPLENQYRRRNADRAHAASPSHVGSPASAKGHHP